MNIKVTVGPRSWFLSFDWVPFWRECIKHSWPEKVEYRGHRRASDHWHTHTSLGPLFIHAVYEHEWETVSPGKHEEEHSP